MNALHLTEEEIQEYVLESAVLEKAVVDHAISCEECKARITNYRVLFAEIKLQRSDAFDFNLVELVVAKLPSPQPKPASDNFFVYLFVLAAAILGGVALYYFRNYIVSLFAGIVPLFIYLTVISVITLSIILSLDMYKTYQRKMRSLDFI